MIKHLRKTSLWFLIFQAGDVITTLYGLSMGLQEINPFASTWWQLILMKFLVIVLVFTVLEFKKRTFWADWIPVGLCGLVIPWNILNIVLK